MKLTKITERQAWAMLWISWKGNIAEYDNVDQEIKMYCGWAVVVIDNWKKCGVIKEASHDKM